MPEIGDYLEMRVSVEVAEEHVISLWDRLKRYAGDENFGWVVTRVGNTIVVIKRLEIGNARGGASVYLASGSVSALSTLLYTLEGALTQLSEFRYWGDVLVTARLIGNREVPGEEEPDEEDFEEDEEDQ